MPCQIVGQVHPRGCAPSLSAAFSSRHLRILLPWSAKEAEVTGKERHEIFVRVKERISAYTEGFLRFIRDSLIGEVNHVSIQVITNGGVV
uniref:OSJNBa0084A10.11 protein n=1 Tax=Oryza sativa subsp. japonica TaxID=39947 RepID=E2PSN2_ORYSJ|nr:OSJNBa0084A10.11 [Oryza sativa Japonica Group]